MQIGIDGVLRRRFIPFLARIGVRPRVSLVAMISILPLTAVLVVGVVKDRNNILKAAATHALDLARFGAERQDDIYQDAKNVLTVLRRLPPAATADPDACHAALRQISGDYPEFTSIGFVDDKGMITCFSLNAPLQPFRDMDLHRATMAADPSAFVVGRFMIGPITGKPIVVAAEPLVSRAGDGLPAGIVYVSLDLDRAAERGLDFAPTTDATLALIDTRNATLLVRSADQRKLAGKTIAGSPLVSAMLAHPQGGSVEAVDVDGTPRIFGFAPLAAGGGSGLMVAAGLSRAAVLAEADRRLEVGVAVAVLTALGTAVLAWLFADRAQVRPIRALVATAQKLGAGDLGARADLPLWQAPEFRALGETLGHMAQSIAAAHSDLAASERQLRILADNATDMILIVREGGERVYASPACRRLLGWEPEEMLRIATRDAVHPDDVGFLQDPRAYSDDGTATFVYRMRRKDGGYIWIESVSRALPREAGRPGERIVVARDISLRVAAEQRLRESETRYRFLAENGADMVFQLDRDLVRRYVSPACREILGYEPEDLLGVKPVAMAHPEDAERVARGFQSVIEGAVESASVVNRIRHRDGRWIWVEARLRALKDAKSDAPSGVIGSLRDISVRKAAEDQLERANRRLAVLAGQDGLTDLANRRTFDDALSREYSRAAREKTRLALVMIDIDHFKSFNDRHGHLAGDEALRLVSRAIDQSLRRPGDLAARYGGEEFAALLPDTDEAGAATIAEEIRRAVLALAIDRDFGAVAKVTISAGVASLAPSLFDAGPHALVRDADRALYQAKNSSRNAVVRASALDKGQSSAA